MSWKLIAGLTLISLSAGCSEKRYAVTDLPSSPDGALKVRAYTLDDGALIKVSTGAEWDEFEALNIGQCSGLAFYWKGPRQAVLEYDKVQILHFMSPSRYYGGASISICDRRSGNCGAPIGKKQALPGCDDRSM